MRNSSNPDELFIRLYLDRHIKLRLADDLRERGFDVLTTQQAKMDTASDEQQLAFAIEQDRAILTFNIRDFAPLQRGQASFLRKAKGARPFFLLRFPWLAVVWA